MNTQTKAEKIVACRALVASGMARTIRIDAGLSIREMADSVDCAAGTLFRYENGRVRVAASIAPRYLRVLSTLAKVQP